MQLTVGAEAVATTRKYLMSVSLMPHVPHNAVVGSLENVVQGYRQLYHTQTGC